MPRPAAARSPTIDRLRNIRPSVTILSTSPGAAHAGRGPMRDRPAAANAGFLALSVRQRFALRVERSDGPLLARSVEVEDEVAQHVATQHAVGAILHEVLAAE